MITKTLDELREQVKKLLGIPPYNEPSNICWNDNYFAKSLRVEYGDQAVSDMIKEVEAHGKQST